MPFPHDGRVVTYQPGQLVRAAELNAIQDGVRSLAGIIAQDEFVQTIENDYRVLEGTWTSVFENGAVRNDWTQGSNPRIALPIRTRVGDTLKSASVSLQIRFSGQATVELYRIRLGNESEPVHRAESDTSRHEPQTVTTTADELIAPQVAYELQIANAGARPFFVFGYSYVLQRRRPEAGA